MLERIQPLGSRADQRIKIAVVGLGRTGWKNHLAQLAKMPERYEIVGACDPIESRCRGASLAYQCEAWTSLPEMLNQCKADWIVIATPTPLHEEQVVASLSAGYHVLCEKPMAGSLAAARRMQEVSKRTGKHLSVFHNRRYAADFLKIREILANGCLGRILLIKIAANTFSRRWDWQTLRKHMGGSLLNAGPHFLDQAIQLLNGDISEIRCSMERALTAGDAEDHVRVHLHSNKGPAVEIELSNADAYGADRWKIYGTSGGLCGSDKSFRWKYTNWEALPSRVAQEGPSPDRTYDREVIPWTEHVWSADSTSATKEIRFYEALYQAVTLGTPLPVTAEGAIRVVEATMQCMEQGRNATERLCKENVSKIDPMVIHS